MPGDIEVKAELNVSQDVSDELLEWARENIREDPDTKYQILEDFRDMIYSRGECAPHRTDDAFLLRFLRGRNFVMERAYVLLTNYCELRENHPEFIDNVGFELLERIGEHDVINVPPYRELSGRRMLIYRLGNWSPDFFTIDDVFKASLLILELAILEPQAQIKGGICVFDLAGIGMNHAWYMSSNIANLVFKLMVTSFPMKVHALHVINQPWMFDTIYSFFRSFLDDRMKERIFFHGNNMESFHKHVDPKCLPERYGGAHPDYNYKDWLVGFKKNKTILEEMKLQGYKVPEEECGEEEKTS